MNRETVFNEIKDGKMAGVYLFIGQEEYEKKEAVEALRKAILPEGLEALNETVFDSADALQIIESAETIPVMCDKRLVLVRDWPPLMKAGKSDRDGEKAEPVENDDSVKRLLAWMGNAPDTCVTVFFVHGDGPVRKSMKDAFDKMGRTVSFDPLSDAELSKWLRDRLKPYKKTIRAEAVNELTFLAGRELTRLNAEVEKLAAYTRDEKEITVEDIRAAVVPDVEASIFRMIDALVAKDAVKAYAICNAMLDAGEIVTNIVSMLVRQMRMMTQVKLLLDDKIVRYEEIASRMGENPYAVKMTIPQCNKIPAKKLLAAYKKSVEIEFEMKKGNRQDKEALDQLMLLFHLIL